MDEKLQISKAVNDAGKAISETAAAQVGALDTKVGASAAVARARAITPEDKARFVENGMAVVSVAACVDAIRATLK